MYEDIISLYLCVIILLNFVKISIPGPTQDNTIQKIVIFNYSFSLIIKRRIHLRLFALNIMNCLNEHVSENVTHSIYNQLK